MVDLWQQFLTQLSNNQFLSGGALLGAAGMLLASFRGLPARFIAWCKRRVLIELNIPDRDEAFHWVDNWLAHHNYQKRCRNLTVTAKSKLLISRYPSADEDETCIHHVRTKPTLSPAPGIHYFFYKSRLVILRRDRKEVSTANEKFGGFQETFSIKILGRSRQIVYDLLEEARNLTLPPKQPKVLVYTPTYDDWGQAAKKHPRTLDSIILDNNLGEILLKDIQTFQKSENWYHTLGIPYRRGYLLYGPPGSGKTSLIFAIASELKFDICTLNLGSPSLTDDKLAMLIECVDKKSFLLIEDIDCLFNARQKDSDNKTQVTFSGLLNALDGVVASDGRILFMTTNNRDKLDAALIRPGRCDLHLEIGNASPHQAECLFLRFFPEAMDEAKQFSEHLPLNVSMADLQGFLLQNRNDAKIALARWIQ